jgi:superfamily II DNA or RNA helicase
VYQLCQLIKTNLKTNNSESKFILGLTEHRVFGSILVPYFIKLSPKGNFYDVHSVINHADIVKEPEQFNTVETEIVKIAEKYSDESLAKRFSRGKRTAEFFRNIDQKLFDDHVIPFVENQIVACLDMVRKNNVDLYVKGTNYNSIHHDDNITIVEGVARAVFHFNLTNDAFRYHLEITHNDKPLVILKKKPVIITNSPCRLALDNKIYFFDELSGKRLLPFVEKTHIDIPLTVTEKYLKTFVRNIVGGNEVVASGFDIVKVEQNKKAVISIETGLRLEPIIVLVFQYGNQKFKAGRKAEVAVELKQTDGRFVFYKHYRDFEWEHKIVSFFADRGFDLIGEQLRFSLAYTDAAHVHDYMVINWINEFTDDLAKHGIEIKQAMGKNFYTGSINLDVKAKLEKDWFDLYAVVQLNDFEVPFIHFKHNIVNKIREYLLPNGQIVILPQIWFEKYSDLFHFIKGKDEKLKVSKHHYKLLNEGFGLRNEEVERAFDQIENVSFKMFDPPKGLNAALRNYQQAGYSWMRLMTANRFGACLADDMGLGKTLQTLSVLLHEKEQTEMQVSANRFNEKGIGMLFAEVENSKPASLVIVPTSLVHNWLNEIKKFTPAIKAFAYVGIQRRKITKVESLLNKYDVIITSYGTIRNDFQLFEQLIFNYIILDESQYIKNASSKTYKTVCELHAERKLVLTGTPVENSLSDLWSQINFLNKGLLGSLKFFKENFIIPIEKNQDEDMQKQLQKIISPFILRRTKEEVATELPPLTEQLYYCEMLEEQAELYEKEKSAIRNHLLNHIDQNGMAGSSFIILQAMTRLRQLSNHPAMLRMEGVGSGKFDQVLHNIENLMAEKHKVLIFSSFVTHLKLFQLEFEKRGWGYCLLTGQTANREKVIADFQGNDEKQLFLISIKAGGVGLNLTSADYIFILDPWWNPAVENQAIARAHRIGQNKKVFVYRFITRGTIEGKIQDLKERKALLADKFVQSRSPFDSVTSDEIKALFD